MSDDWLGLEGGSTGAAKDDWLGLDTGQSDGAGGDSFDSPPESDKGSLTWGDRARSVMAGVKDTEAGAGWLLQKYGEMTDHPMIAAAGSYFADKSASDADTLNQGQSDYSKSLDGKPFLKDRSDWRDPESVKQFASWGDLSPGETWDKVQKMAAESSAGTLAGMGAGGIASKALRMLPGVSKALGATLGFSAGETLVSTPSDAKQAGDEVRGMSEDQLAQHVEYQAMMLEDVPKKVAREKMARAAEGDTAALSSLSTFVLSSPFGNALEKVLGGESRNIIGGFLKGGLTEAGQETLQSGGSQAAVNTAVLENADPNRSLMKDVPESMVAGGLSGFAMGGPLGAVSGHAEDSRQTQQGHMDRMAEEAAQRAREQGGDGLDAELARQQVYWNSPMPTDGGAPPGGPNGPDAPINFNPYQPGMVPLKESPYVFAEDGKLVTRADAGGVPYEPVTQPTQELSLTPLESPAPTQQPGNMIDFPTPGPSVLDEKAGAVERAADEYQRQKEAISYEKLAQGPERDSVDPAMLDSLPPGKPALQEVHERIKDEMEKRYAEAVARSGPTKANNNKDINKLPMDDRELLHAIASLGGLDRDEAKAQGVDPAEFRRRIGGLAHVFTKSGGKSFDDMAETLSQHGFFGQEKYSANGLLDKLHSSMSGTPQYSENSSTAAERQASQADADRIQQALYEFERDSYTDPDEPPKGPRFSAASDEERRVSYAILEAEMAGVDPVMIDHIILDYDLPDADTEAALKQAINNVKQRRSETQGAAGQAAGNSEGNQTAPRGQGAAQESGQQETAGQSGQQAVGAGFTLAQETEEQRAAREAGESAQVAAANKEKSEAEKKAKQEKGEADTKAAVDSSVHRFELGQSADQQLSGQTSLLDSAAHEAATSPNNDLNEPSEAQKAAGNYKKGHVRFQGLDISIENPKGSTRSGKDPDGNEWSHEMQSHYGYIKRTEGADGDHVDTFVGPNTESQKVYVVDQVNSDGSFDEVKSMLGFDSEAEAVAAYKENYDDDWKVGPVTEMSVDQFKDWLANGDTTKPVARSTNAASNEGEKVDPAGNETQYKMPGTSSDSNAAWREIRNGRASITELQQQLVDYVKEANDAGADTYRQMVAHIEREHPGFLPENTDNGIDGGANQTEVNNAHGYLTSEQQKGADKKAAETLAQYQSGAKIGAITPNTGKKLTNAQIVSVNAHGYFVVQATSGNRRVEITLSPSRLLRAIERAQPELAAQLGQRSKDDAKEKLSAAADKLAREKADKALAEKMLTEEYEDEQGNAVTVEESALDKVRRLSKRLEICDQLLGCLKK